jgi:hypothetical protein
VHVRQVPVPLGDVEAVADEELVGDGEPDVADGEILDEAAVRAIEERDDREGAGLAQPERLAEIVERQAGIDDVLDEQDVAMCDLGVQVLQEADARVAARFGIRAVAGQLDEVDRVRDRQRARQVGEKDEAGLQRRDEQRLAPGVVACDLAAELGDPRRELLPRQVDLADRRGRRYDASSRRYRCAKRSRSRL